MMKRILLTHLWLVWCLVAIPAQSSNNYLPANTTVQLTETTLPIVMITTGDQSIDRQNAIVGTLRIIDNGKGQTNYPDINSHHGQALSYDGSANLKYWGGTEFTHQRKKPLSITKQDGSELLLQSLYADRSLIRAQLTRILAKDYMTGLPLTRHCEVIIDGIYHGIYLLSENKTATINMADYLLAAELAHDTDCYRFYTAEENSTSKTLTVSLLNTYMGYGNNYAQDGWRTDTWIYDENTLLKAQDDPWLIPNTWKTMTENADFKKEIRQKWAARRNLGYSNERITEVIDSMVHILKNSGAINRESQAWGKWGKRVWPNYRTPASFDDEISWMKDWITQRLTWMDSRLSGDEIITQREPLTINGYNEDAIAEASPASTHVTADLDDNHFVFYSAAFRSTGGLPANGRFTSEHSGVTYQLGNYAQNNILRLGTQGAAGTLTLNEPTTMSQLYIVLMAGNGNGSCNMKVTYEDNTSQEQSLSVKDWGNGNGMLRLNRMLTTQESVNTNQSWYLYEDSVETDNTKKIKEVTFTSTSAPSWEGYQPVISIFALSGQTEQVITAIPQTEFIEPSSEVTRIEYYDLSGRKLSQMQHGVNLIIKHTPHGIIRKKIVF